MKFHPPHSALRAPQFAGRFYPSDPIALRRMVEGFVAAATAAAGPAPKALIAPHAGYIFSGPIAGSAYAQWLPARKDIHRVVVLGPSHYVAFDGLAAVSFAGFTTPLGAVPVDTGVSDALGRLAQVRTLDAAHAHEHSIEVQLPFLQVVLDDFKVVPLAVGEASAESISEVIETLWGGPETRFVVSSDLSHFHDSEHAKQLDAAAAQAIEELAPERLGEDQACGRAPICGMLHAAQRRGLGVRTLDLRNSGDTAGPRDRVVGYGAFALTERA